MFYDMHTLILLASSYICILEVFHYMKYKACLLDLWIKYIIGLKHIGLYKKRQNQYL